MKQVLALAGVVCAVSALSFQTGAADYSLTLAYIPVKGTNYVEVVESLPEGIAKATGDRVEIRITPSLIPGPKLASAVRDGQVEMAAVINAYLSASEPRLGLQNLPGLIGTFAEYRAVYDAFWGADLARVWKTRFNSEVLIDSVFCPQALISTEAIVRVDDFAGKKIRVHNTETAKLVDMLGAKPTSIPAAEVLPALDRGVIDGVFTASCWAHGQGFGTVAKNVTDWQVASIQGWALLMNNDAWDRLPADLKRVIKTEMAGVQAAEFDSYEADARATVAAWESAGVTYTVATAEQRRELFRDDRIAPVYDAWRARAEKVGFDGTAYITRARQALNP